MTFRPVNNPGIGYFMITPCEEHLPREAGNRTLAGEVTREGGESRHELRLIMEGGTEEQRDEDLKNSCILCECMCSSGVMGKRRT